MYTGPFFFLFFFEKCLIISTRLPQIDIMHAFSWRFVYSSRAAVTGDPVFHPYFSEIGGVSVARSLNQHYSAAPKRSSFSNSKCCFLLGNWELHVLVISASRNIWVGDLFFMEFTKVVPFNNVCEGEKATRRCRIAPNYCRIFWMLF